MSHRVEKKSNKWRSSLPWLVAAPLSVVVLAGASSQPLVDVYLPWSWTREHTVEHSGEFAMPVALAPDATHAAQIEVLGFQLADPKDLMGITPPEGFVTWVVLTQWHADPESILGHCQMWATADDGREYTLTNAAYGATIPDPNFDTWSLCTPPDEPGPYVAWDDSSLNEDSISYTIDPGIARPEEWRKATLIIVPEGVQPTQLHIGWDKPHFVTVVLPEPEEFLSES